MTSTDNQKPLPTRRQALTPLLSYPTVNVAWMGENEVAANTSTTDKRLDDLRDDMKDMRADIRQIRNWLFAGGIAIVATLIATLLNIFIGS